MAATWIDKESTSLIARLEDDRDSAVKHPFNKILLRFPLIRASFASIRKAFHAEDPTSTHTIPLGAVPKVLASLNAHCSDPKDIDLIFSESAVDGVLSYRSFLVCLAVGNVIGRITIGGGHCAAAVPASPTASATSEAGVSASHDLGSLAAHKEGVRRASFSQEEALKLEGDSETAAQVAAMAARKLHAAEEGQAQDAISGGAGAAAGAGGSSSRRSISNGASGTPFTPSSSSSARTPALNDPAVVSWAFHLILEAFLQICHEGVIRKSDLHQGMATLAMLSPSTKVREHGKKETPIRTHELPADGGAAPSESGNGSSTGRVGFGGATAVGTAAEGGALAEVEAFPVGSSSSSSSSAVDEVAQAGRRGSASGSALRRASGAAAAASASGVNVEVSDEKPRKVIPASALEFLSADRFAELDFNANGEVSFSEWVACFISWAEADSDEDEGDDDDGAAGDAGSGFSGAGAGSK